MTYELFKQSIGGDVASDDPMQKAMWAEYANRNAAGIVNDISVYVKTMYVVEDNEDSYKMKVELETGRYWTEEAPTKFAVDALFEKLVREYGLTEEPTEEDLGRINDKLGR